MIVVVRRVLFVRLLLFVVWLSMFVSCYCLLLFDVCSLLCCRLSFDVCCLLFGTFRLLAVVCWFVWLLVFVLSGLPPFVVVVYLLFVDCLLLLFLVGSVLFICCVLLYVVCCSLIVVCCSLFVVRDVLFLDCCSWLAIDCCWLLVVVWCMLVVVCCVLLVV